MLQNFSIKRRVILAMCGLAAATPVLLTALLAYIYHYWGVESFFNEKIKFSVESTVKVADLYLNEHKKNIQIEAFTIANLLEQNSHIVYRYKDLLPLFLDSQAEASGLTEVIVFTHDKVLARNSLGFTPLFAHLSHEILERAEKERVVIVENADLNNKVNAIIKLYGFFAPTYLLVGRYIDHTIIHYLNKTQEEVGEYHELLRNINVIKSNLKLAFVVLSLLIIVFSIFIANKLANLIVRPLDRLVKATAQVKLDAEFVKLTESNNNNEITLLTKTFNSMTSRIKSQRDELISARDTIDNRRRFIETVLSELSAGVIALDSAYNISLSNNSARHLLDFDKTCYLNPKLHINEIFPELGDIYDLSSFVHHDRNKIQHLIVKRSNKELHLLVKVAFVFVAPDSVDSIIITFNDITELVLAQRLAAWRDIAKRIAHEIKNPLTPIYLAAERLKAQHLKKGIDASENFHQYLDMIMRSVSEMENIVSEFVEYTTMSKPHFGKFDLNAIVREALMLQKVTYQNIQYKFDNTNEHCYVECDQAQISRVMMNLLKNAAESISCKIDEMRCAYAGRVDVHIFLNESNRAVVEVIDNGVGISKSQSATKSKGMGLGLSIVKKILEDHGGQFALYNHVGGGACASFCLKYLDDPFK